MSIESPCVQYMLKSLVDENQQLKLEAAEERNRQLQGKLETYQKVHFNAAELKKDKEKAEEAAEHWEGAYNTLRDELSWDDLMGNYVKSVRARNAVYGLTVGQTVRMGRKALTKAIRYRASGGRTLQEIEDGLARLGFRLRA